MILSSFEECYSVVVRRFPWRHFWKTGKTKLFKLVLNQSSDLLSIFRFVFVQNLKGPQYYDRRGTANDNRCCIFS